MTTEYESWGRYPRHTPSDVIKLFWRDELPELSKIKGKILPYAFGKSYGDSCLNDKGTLIDTRGLNKIIAFDPQTGIIRCEAGVTLAAILNFAIPRGWFLSVTPGTKYISVAGALANDVHGKNHHRGGTFGCHVTSFELIRSNGERVLCSPEENPDMFKATIGGMGLTGLITWVEFRLKPCPGPYFDMESIKLPSLDEFFDVSSESDKDFEYTVSWVDCTAVGSETGRGIFTRGNHAPKEKQDLSGEAIKEPASFPFEAPFINACSVNMFNMLFYNKQLNNKERSTVHYDQFFYPLDAVAGWNKAYGKNGFLQYQFIVPFKNDRQVIRKLLNIVSKSGLSSFLTVLKTFGDIESPGMMSFPRPGVTMAIDFRMDGSKTLNHLNELDSIVRDAGGGFYPAKDARMEPSDFRRFYPNWKEFSEYIDPKFSSGFWRRMNP